MYRYEIIANKLCCCRKKRQKNWNYIFYFDEFKMEGDEGIDPWQGRIKGIKKELERMQKKN